MIKEIEIQYKEPGIKLETQPDFRELAGIIKTVNFIPNWIPKKFSECQAIYASGAVYRHYMYDGVGNTWRYINLT